MDGEWKFEMNWWWHKKDCLCVGGVFQRWNDDKLDCRPSTNNNRTVDSNNDDVDEIIDHISLVVGYAVDWYWEIFLNIASIISIHMPEYRIDECNRECNVDEIKNVVESII